MEKIEQVNGLETINKPSNTATSTLSFRALRANEVEIRPSKVEDNKVTLLLYQDARCAQNILDETVGPFNWQREYYSANNLIFCRIGIKNKEDGTWVWKSDAGAESKIESEKGLASDAFKRAAVNWGIGRELYSAPTINIKTEDKDMFNGKFCQSFSVSKMEISNGIIQSLAIIDKWGNERYSYSRCYETNTSNNKEEVKEVKVENNNTEEFKSFCTEMKGKQGTDINELKKFYAYYTKLSTQDKTKTVIEAFKNPVPEKLWNRWIEQASKPKS